MDSNRLAYFVVVNETGSIRRAAELLRLSPAALSKAIKQLEFEAGFKLLVPAGRGILVTDEGKDLAARAKPLLDSLATLAQGVSNKFKDGASLNTPLRLGTFEVFSTHFLSEILKAFAEDGGSLLLRELIPGEMEQALLNREIDLGLSYIPIPTAGIEYFRITSIEMGIFGTAELKKSLAAQEFSAWPFVIPIQPISGSPNKVQGLDGWPDDRWPRHVGHRVTMMESALSICRQALAVAYLPTFVVRYHNQIVKPKFQLEALATPKGLPALKQDVYLVKRKSDVESSAAKKLAKAVRLGCRI